MLPPRDAEPDSAWNRTERNYPTHRLVHELFEDRVRERPDAVAVTCGEVCLTYQELKYRAAALALELRRRYEIGPGALVGLVLDRSEHVLISMLAVLKAGAAYVPIAPDTPDRRIELILRESRSRVVLTDERHRTRLSGIVDGAKLSVEVLVTGSVTGADSAAEASRQFVESRQESDSLAYVIYTSGTTGRPKGVMVEHRSVVNYICNVEDRLGLSADDVCGYSTNVSFDLTITTTLACLALGGRVAVYSDEARDVDVFRRFLAREGVTFIKLTPSYFGLVAGSMNETSVRTVVLGGEKLGRAVLERIRVRDDQELTVHDEYGPTEATVGTCDAVVYPLPEGVTPNIGQLYGNYRGYVLDPDLRPVGVGEAGELFIGGLGLARGYLDQPELTSERFLTDPFAPAGEKGTARVYRTGDLVRWLPGGELEYLGRNDDQVKIRGFRVELGEVEHAVESYGDVERAVVAARTVDSEDEIRGLVAYVVADEFGCAEEALTEYLRDILPEYLLPSAYVFLDELPLTSNGKVDRAALPKPEQTAAEQYVAPRTDLERTVAEVWTEMLGRDGRPIGITDDFFRLGGDSIVAIQLLGRLRQPLGVHLPVHELLGRPTIERFCEFLVDRLATPDDEGGEIDPVVGEVPLLPIQEWFFRNDFARPNHWNQAFLITTPRLDVDRLRECVRELGNRHGAFRLRYRHDASGELVQYYEDEYQPSDLVTGSFARPADLRAQLTEWQADFDLEHGPVYRIGYLDGFPDGGARVFVACHHMVVDAVSWRVLAEDLEALYHGRGLPPVGSSYRQWTTAVREYPSQHPEEFGYWRRVQEEYSEIGDSALLRLVESESTRTVSELALDRETTERLLRCHRAYRTQINDVLLAAFAHALTDLTGESVNHVVLEGHGREEVDPRLDVSRTVGWFTTMFPVRLAANADLLATLCATKEALREIPTKGIGYGPRFGYHDDRLPRINFNYLGRLDSQPTEGDEGRWQLTREPSGAAMHPDNRDNNIISVNGWIVDGRLSFSIANKLGQEAGDRLVARYERCLVELIGELSAASRSYLTPSDVDHVVSAEYLDEIQSEREIEGVFLANSLQQGFIYQAVAHSRDDDAYTVQMTWDYATCIDVDAVHEAWIRAQREFPALRLRFGWREALVQIVDADASVDWRHIDLSGKSAEHQAASIERLRAADRSEPYDLGTAALFRIYLVKQGPARFSCLFSHHHSILDGWSNTVLLSRVHELYEAMVAGLPTRSAPDRSYLAGQRYLQKHREDHREFWRNHLAQHKERMDLQGLLKPTARRDGLQVEATRRVQDMRELSFAVEGDQYAALRGLSQNVAVTLNALILYVWHRTLACYTTAKQTATGVVLSGRGIPVNDIDTSVGLFINTLPLIVPEEVGAGTVSDGIKAVQRSINELNAHSTVNLAELHEGADRLFDTLFIYENWPKISPDGWQSRLAVGMGKEYEKLDYPLSVIVSEVSGSILFRLVYAAELFDARDMAAMLNMQRHLLSEALTDASRPWREVDLISAAQHRELSAVLNPEAEALPPTRTLVDIFEEQVRRNPDRRAVSFEGTTLSYAALDELANRLAHLLSDAHGVQPGELVVLCLDKGLDLIVSILAVLKARAAYVLTDPTYPDSRFCYILRDTGSGMVITAARDRDRIRALADPDSAAAVLALDTPDVRQALAAASPSAPGTHPPLDALMYVLYTSGTTGAPKGVMIEHRAYAQTIAAVKARHFAHLETVSTHSLTNQVFDIFGLEYGLPLWTGGSVELAGAPPATLNCYGLDFVQMTPSVCDVMLDRLVGVPEDLLLLVGGERLSKELLERVLARSIDLVNVYGPTETTIWSTSRLYRHVDGLDALPVSIGTPFAGESVHVLDDELRPLPLGAVGELCIGGDGLARGYLNRETLTAERFVDVPSGPIDSAQPLRLYRTGDLVRLLPSGILEFIGRNDAQVKINGHRIELGEVDSALAAHPAVRQSVVHAVEFGAPTLIGYYVANEEIPEAELDEHLRRLLPGYMMPARCIHLESMPLTINGKVDRAALPRPSAVGTRMHVPPRSRTEADLCALAARLLGIDPVDVGIEDDFFQLGGTSLLSIKLVSAMERELGISTTVEYLLEHRTVRELVENLGEASARVVIPVAAFEQAEEQQLSFAQERLWFIERFEGGTDAYNLPLVLEVAETVDTEMLLTAARGVIAQHDVLRTVLRQTPDGTAYQEVLDADMRLKIEVLRMADRRAMHAEIRRDLRRVFNLATEWPLRARLYEAPDAGRRLVFAVHHVAFDGWSTDVLLEDLLTAYDLVAHAEPGTDPFAKLPAPRLRYRDFAVWQRDQLTGERLDRLRRFWERELEDYQNLDLVPDRPRPDSLDYHGANIRLEIGAEVSRRLRQLAEELHVSLFSLLLSAHFLTLRCFSHQDDIVVGAPVANRDHPQLARLIGFFVNTLPLRSRIDGRARISDYVRETARGVLDMLRHQELPVEQMLEILDIERDVSRHPIFQVTFGVQSFGAPARGPDGTSEAVLRTAPETKELYTAARFDLSTFIDDSLESLEININYATSLFESDTVESLGQTYLTILRQFAALAGSESKQRRAAISDLAYVDGERYRELVEEWSAPKQRYPSDMLLHRSVEEYARRTPDCVALVWQERRLTYRELNAEANRLAHHMLHGGGVEPDATVLLCLDRGEDIVISILATLKAGGGYLPADPTYPDDRIGFMLADAGARTIVTHQRYVERFAGIVARAARDDERLAGVEVVAVDDPQVRESLRAMSETDPATAVGPGNLAYVLYTSGTTGKPKGVPQTHANVARLFTALSGVYQIRDDDVWTLFHNYVFDFTVWEMWGAFLYGGRLVVPTFEETRDPELYYALCRRERVTMLCQTPTAFYQFVNVALGKDEQHRVDDLRYVFFGGEPLNVSLLGEWFARYSRDRPLLAMGYGTTETTVFTCYKIYDETDEGSTDIGSLIPDVAGYVLDSERRLLPMGAVGELYIGGAGLASGFVNLPDLTTTKFIANPFALDDPASADAEWNTRLYKSGDLVRWAPDRTLRFVGRNDLQVKIRGHRIELGEIETVLSSVPGVVQCAVVVCKTGDGGGQSHLVGYYVAEAWADSDALYEQLQAKLPTYMIPAALVPVDELPRKISGKLDVNALPSPQLSATREFVAPRDERETLVRDVMAEVLGADPAVIGVHDDFFRLGGNSILSIKLASRLSAELGLDVSIASVFRRRSVAGLVDGLGTVSAAAVAIPRLAGRAETEQVASFAQERFWFINQYDSENVGYNIDLCYEVLPDVDVDVLERCLREVIRRHEVLRTVIRQAPDGGLYQMVLDPEKRPIDVQHITVTDEADLAARFGAERRRTFDLTDEAQAPLRVVFYRQEAAEGSPGRTFVGIVVHHIAFDGWSADILLDELSRLYSAAALPELRIQYKDYAAWEREHVGGARLAELLGYWTGRLRGRRPLELPTDRIRPAKIDHSGGRVSFELDPKTSVAARRVAHESRVGLFSVLLSAFLLTLRAYTGRSDLLVGIPVVNRTHIRTHELIGCFTNTLALDFDIDGDDDVVALIEKVGARVVEAQEHQELPFERLVAELDLPVDPARHPLFQIWFDVNSFAETDADRLAEHQTPPTALLRTHTLKGHANTVASAINSNLDFGLVMNDAGESLTGAFTYATALFDHGTVARFATTYQSILTQFARAK
ncbi:amino acid adenylation domain-containing protein [Nocardia vinacea]|uniref:amino acid adenylation domain-containing protein n=1 Tax=Nocardia vinacea TaxID=96468 RepID=UPI0034234331